MRWSWLISEALDTVRICRAAGANVVHRDLQGYAEQKQAALELGSGEWILNLDAD